MSSLFLLYDLRGLFICLGFLIGIGGGAFLLMRKRTGAGILAIAGFALFSVEPIVGFITRQALSSQMDVNPSVLFNVTSCLTGLATFLGSLAMVGALLLALRSNTPSSEFI